MATINSAETRKWYQWFSGDESKEEKKLIVKLDLLIVPYAFIVYWVKYIDQGNISEHPFMIIAHFANV